MKYSKKEFSDIYGDNVLVDKSIIANDKVAESLYQLMKNSPYTRGELEESLSWESHKMAMVLSGDEIIDVSDITHFAGALGYSFDITFTKIED